MSKKDDELIERFCEEAFVGEVTFDEITRIPTELSTRNHLPSTTCDEDTEPLEEGSEAETRDSDYEYARKTLKNAIDKGKNALRNLEDLCATSEHPRAYDAMAKLLKSLTESTKEFLELHKKMQDLEGDSGDKEKNKSGGVTNNAIFVGNTKDLLEMMDQRRRQKEQE